MAGSEEARAADPDWRGYLAALEAAGYFGGSPPGTEQHRALLAAAGERYAAVAAYRRRTAELATPAVLGRRLLQVGGWREAVGC